MTVERHTYVLRKYRFIIGLSISRNDRMSSVLMEDITSAEFSTGVIGGPVDYITAIGVMFHIVDDERWERAVQNLAAVLKPDGVMFIGGDFGPETRNVQFHRKDEFKDWREHGTAEVPKDEVRINKRVRSLAYWCSVIHAYGLEAIDLVRSDRDPVLTTPENDLLVVKKR